MRRVLRPGGRIVVAVWGATIAVRMVGGVSGSSTPRWQATGARRSSASDRRTRWRSCAALRNSRAIEHRRLAGTLFYADAEEPATRPRRRPVALAWSRFDIDAAARVRARYVDAIEPWRRPGGYELPGEFVLVAAVAPR